MDLPNQLCFQYFRCFIAIIMLGLAQIYGCKQLRSGVSAAESSASGDSSSLDTFNSLMSSSKAKSISEVLGEWQAIYFDSRFSHVRNTLQMSIDEKDPKKLPLCCGDFQKILLEQGNRVSPEFRIVASLLRNFVPIYHSRGMGMKDRLDSGKQIEVQRYVTFTDDGSLFLAIPGQAASQTSPQTIEVLWVKKGDDFTGSVRPSAWEISESGPKPAKADQCETCHGDLVTTPIFDQYPHWPGMLPSQSAGAGSNYASIKQSQDRIASPAEKRLLAGVLESQSSVLGMFQRGAPIDRATLDKTLVRMGYFVQMSVFRLIGSLVQRQIKKSPLVRNQVADFLSYLAASKETSGHPYRTANMSFYFVFLEPQRQAEFVALYLRWRGEIADRQSAYLTDLLDRINRIQALAEDQPKKSLAVNYYPNIHATAEMFAFLSDIGIPDETIRQLSPSVQGTSLEQLKKKASSHAFFDGINTAKFFEIVLADLLDETPISKEQETHGDTTDIKIDDGKRNALRQPFLKKFDEFLERQDSSASVSPKSVGLILCYLANQEEFAIPVDIKIQSLQKLCFKQFDKQISSYAKLLNYAKKHSIELPPGHSQLDRTGL